MIAHLFGVSRRRSPAASNSGGYRPHADTIRICNAAGKLELKPSGTQQPTRASTRPAEFLVTILANFAGLQRRPAISVSSFSANKKTGPRSESRSPGATDRSAAEETWFSSHHLPQGVGRSNVSGRGLQIARANLPAARESGFRSLLAQNLTEGNGTRARALVTHATLFGARVHNSPITLP
jgi:hypothetical protein